MTAAITFFVISLVAIVTMIFLKLREPHTGKTLLPLSFREKADAVIKDKVEMTKWAFSLVNKKNAMIFVHELLSLVSRLLHFSHKKVIEKKAVISLELKKRNILEKKGSASIFLRNVSEYKDRLSH